MAGSDNGGEALAERLAARREEIEETVLTRVQSVEDPTKVEDPEYLSGLKRAVQTALGRAITVLEGGGEGASSPTPAELLAQARLAARSGVSLNTVVRRYLAGHTLLCDYLLREAGPAPAAVLQPALRAEATLLDHIVVDVGAAYEQELRQRQGTVAHRHTERVKRLLAGEPQDVLDLRYDFELWHLGVLATGVGAPAALRELALALDRRLLLVRPGGRETWAWLGGHRVLTAKELIERARPGLRSDLILATGEPARGISGWRLTHLQAKAALPIARHGKSRIIDYSDVAILASVLGNEVLTTSLTERYLTPLAAERDGGAILRGTLRAYFAAGRNVASTAAALGVSRQTVTRRLNAIEEKIADSIERRGTEIETALRIRDLGQRDASPSS